MGETSRCCSRCRGSSSDPYSCEMRRESQPPSAATQTHPKAPGWRSWARAASLSGGGVWFGEEQPAMCTASPGGGSILQRRCSSAPGPGIVLKLRAQQRETSGGQSDLIWQSLGWGKRFIFRQHVQTEQRKLPRKCLRNDKFKGCAKPSKLFSPLQPAATHPFTESFYFS